MKFLSLTILSLMTSLTLSAQVLVGDPAPNDMSLIHILPDGSQAELKMNEPQGKYLIYDFFATTCKYCIENLPLFSQMAQEIENTTFSRIIMVDRNTNSVDQFFSEYHQYITFPLALDNNRTFLKAFGVYATPTLFVVNPENKIIFKHVGSLKQEQIDQIKSLVKDF